MYTSLTRGHSLTCTIANFSAPLIICSSSQDTRSLLLVIVTRFDLPVVLSRAEALKIPLASM